MCLLSLVSFTKQFTRAKAHTALEFRDYQIATGPYIHLLTTVRKLNISTMEFSIAINVSLISKINS